MRRFKRLVIPMLLGALLAPPAAGAQAIPSIAPAAAAPASPAASAPPITTMAPSTVVRETLANGMHVILLPNALAPVATTLMSYGVGFNDDTLPGIAHATEHMLFRGTTDLSAGQLADIAARMGAEYNAMTLNEQTVYYYKLPSPYVDVALHVEADRMTHATVRAEAWATERGAIEQEIRASESQPSYALGLKLRQTFFAGTPFATASGGTVPSFEKMTADQIRAFYRSWYGPNNATLIVAGDIDPQKTLARIHQEFDGIATVTLPARAPIQVPALTSATIQSTIDYPIGFGALAYRFPGSNDPDYAASHVLETVFFNGRGKLADLTTQGKTLAVVPLSNAFPEMGASFLLAIPANGATPQNAQQLVDGVLEDYRANGLPVELIESAKMRLLSQEAYREASISGLAFAWSNAIAQRSGTPDAIYDALAKVTPDDVNRVLRTYVTPDHRLSIIISAKPTSAVPKADPSAGVEHVGFTPTVHEPLPAWAQTALSAPLRAPAPDAGVRRGTLPNGLHFSVRRETTAPTVVLNGFVRTAPPLYEPAGKEGVSGIVDGLLPWGTASYDRKAYEAQADAIPATLRLGTSFSLQVRADDFERALALLADGLLHPAFPADAFAVVKKGTLQSVAVEDALPRTKAATAQVRALYPPGDPHRRDTNVRTVGAVTIDDVKRYYRFAYRPDVTTIAIVGDVAPERVEKALRASFGGWKANGKPPSFLYPKIKGRAEGAKTVTVKSQASAQSEVTLKQLFAMRRADGDYVPLLLANTILSGEGNGSLLMEELRTRLGYVYTADSDFHVDFNGAEFSVTFASDPKNVARANAAVVAMIRGLQMHPLPAVELQRAKALLLAERVLPLDSYDGVASSMLAAARLGYVDTGDASWFWNALLRTTPAQVQHAMRRIDPNRFVRVVLEPGS